MLGNVSDSKSDEMQIISTKITNSDSTNIFSAIIKAPTVNPDDVCHDDPAPEQTGSANPVRQCPHPWAVPLGSPNVSPLLLWTEEIHRHVDGPWDSHRKKTMDQQQIMNHRNHHVFVCDRHSSMV